jgi:hypothetical protein
MLVLEAAGLPSANVLCIEPELRGLFSCPRNAGDERRWLVGDHFSVAGIQDVRSIQDHWVHAAVDTLRSLTTVIDGGGVRIGAYAAPKAELRDDPNDLTPYALESYGLSNALLATPTKLTLAPALAIQASRRLRLLESGSTAPLEPELDGDRLEVQYEKWQSIEMRAIEDLSEQ